VGALNIVGLLSARKLFAHFSPAKSELLSLVAYGIFCQQETTVLCSLCDASRKLKRWPGLAKKAGT
jgi:hypothetical protein